MTCSRAFCCTCGNNSNFIFLVKRDLREVEKELQDTMRRSMMRRFVTIYILESGRTVYWQNSGSICLIAVHFQHLRLSRYRKCLPKYFFLKSTRIFQLKASLEKFIELSTDSYIV